MTDVFLIFDILFMVFIFPQMKDIVILIFILPCLSFHDHAVDPVFTFVHVFVSVYVCTWVHVHFF